MAGEYSSKKNSTLDYVQKVAEVGNETSTGVEASNRKQNSSNVRNLLSENSNVVSRDEKSDRQVTSTTSVKNASVERANRAFTISFSIPLKGVLPSAPVGTTNC